MATLSIRRKKRTSGERRWLRRPFSAPELPSREPAPADGRHGLGVLHWLLLALWVLVLTLAILLSWTGVAHADGEAASQRAADDPSWLFGEGKKPADSVRDPRRPAAPRRPGDGSEPQPVPAPETGDPRRTDGGTPPRRNPTQSSRDVTLSTIPDDDLLFSDTLRLVLALDGEFPEPHPAAPGMLRGAIFEHLTDLSIQVGHTDNPRDNLDAVRAYLFETLQMVPAGRSHDALEALLPRRVLAMRRGSDTGLAVIALVLADRLSPYLDVEPIVVGGLLALRYRNGHHRYSLVPRHPQRLHSDHELLTLAGIESDAASPIRVLSRRELWGWVCAEAGVALDSPETRERSAAFLARGLQLFPANARARVTRARQLMALLDSDAAIAELDAAVAANPYSVAVRLARFVTMVEEPAIEPRGDDVRYLTEHGTGPDVVLALVRHHIERREQPSAAELVRRLDTMTLTEEQTTERRRLEVLVEAAPWIDRLASRHPDRVRFRAIDRLTGCTAPEALAGLIDLLDDPNLRLAGYAWRSLRRTTDLQVPRDRAKWLQALGLRGNLNEKDGFHGANSGR